MPPSGVAFCTHAPSLPLSRSKSQVGREFASHNGVCMRARPTAAAPVPVQRVLVLGGTGRVGAATARALAGLPDIPLHITVAGRSDRRGARVADSVRRLNSSLDVENAVVDFSDDEELTELIKRHDVVLHTAGPFQRRVKPNQVLRSVLEHGGKDYVDICDDVAHAEDAKTLHGAARRAGSRALICTGIYPGLSNLAAAAAADRLLEPPISLRIYYYTAGSGGIGATVLASTFLILGSPAQCFTPNGAIGYVPASGLETVDFGGKVGKRATYFINLPEVTSLHGALMARHGGGEAWAKFSTGPPFWNSLLRAMARYVPQDVLSRRGAMQALAQVSIPVVRAVDVFTGARTAFIVEVADAKGGRAKVSYEHSSLRESVGTATAAFVAEICRDRARGKSQLEPGVYYPEELEKRVRDRICLEGTSDADCYELTQSASLLHVHT